MSMQNHLVICMSISLLKKTRHLIKIIVEDSMVAVTKDMSKAFVLLLCCFYVSNSEYLKKLEVTYLSLQKFILGIADKRNGIFTIFI